MVVRGHGGKEVVVRPGCGGLQGDTAMAPMFSSMYDAGIDEWVEGCRDSRGGLEALDPVSGEEQQLASTVFADDVQETNVEDGEGGMEEMIGHSGGAFEEMLKE